MFGLPIQTILIGVLVLAVGGYIAHCSHVSSEYKQLLRIQQEQVAKAKQDLKDRTSISKAQEKKDAQTIKDLNAKYADARRQLQQPSPGATQPLSSAARELNCPDRQADLARGLDKLEAGILGLLQRGDQGILRAASCQEWLEEQLRINPKQ